MAEYLVDCLADTNAEIEEKEPGRVEFSFPLLIIRTKIFGGFFDRLGSLRSSRWISWISLIIVPVVAAFGLFLLSSSLFILLGSPLAREVTRELGPASYLLFPGINPILPFFYGWFALICAIAIHEGAHGIIARNRGLNVKSSGLLFFLFVPIGAFVDVDEKQITKAKSSDSLRVMAAGVGGNIVTAIACLIALLIIINGLTPVVDSIYISSVTDGMPAEKAGLLPGDIFVSFNNVTINDYETLANLLENKNPGDLVQVTVARGENLDQLYTTSLVLIENMNRTIMGVTLFDPEVPLVNYRTLTPTSIYIYMFPPSIASGLVPFSDSLIPFYAHPLGSQWHIYANIFFWIWFVNVNLAVFNALPIYPFDGGRMFDISLKTLLRRKLNPNTISKITYGVTATVLSILLLSIVIPFIF